MSAISRSDSDSSRGRRPLSPPRLLRLLASESSDDDSTVPIPNVYFTPAPAKSKPKPLTACGFYTIEQVIPFLVAHIVKDSNKVAEMLTLQTREKNLTYLNFDGKCIDEWKQSLQLAANVYAKNKMAAVPINIICKENGHLNMLIFNPKKQTVERYEPHGLTSPVECTGANTVLDAELKAELTKLLPSATYIPRADTHVNGFQTLEEKAAEHKDEWGFCATWSTIFARERLRRPDVTAVYAIKQMRSKFGSDPTNLRNIARKQARVLKENIGFNFDTYMNGIFYTAKGKPKEPGSKGFALLDNLDGKTYTKHIDKLFKEKKAPASKRKKRK